MKPFGAAKIMKLIESHRNFPASRSRPLDAPRSGNVDSNNRDTSINAPSNRRQLWLVRTAGLRGALLILLLFSSADRGRTAEKSGFAASDVEAKVEYCQDCHGPSGQGYRGFFPIPRLAGQKAEYLKNQLDAFGEHRRTNNIMFNVAHTLSPAMIAALAANFETRNPSPFGGGKRSLVAAGQKIFQDGVPDANVAACAACHGPEAKGSGEIPRLAGQLPEYIFNKLTNWSKERGQNPAKPDISAVMSPVAHSLTKPQVEAVAAYLSYLK
jgi:cytochrome c553